MSAAIREWTLDTFTPLVGESFGVSAAADLEPEIELTLIEAQASRMAEYDGRHPFSLVFQGSIESALAQQVVVMQHAELGAAELLMVPIGADADSVRYEVIFA